MTPEQREQDDLQQKKERHEWFNFDTKRASAVVRRYEKTIGVRATFELLQAVKFHLDTNELKEREQAVDRARSIAIFAPATAY